MPGPLLSQNAMARDHQSLALEYACRLTQQPIWSAIELPAIDVPNAADVQREPRNRLPSANYMRACMVQRRVSPEMTNLDCVQALCFGYQVNMCS